MKTVVAESKMFRGADPQVHIGERNDMHLAFKAHILEASANFSSSEQYPIICTGRAKFAYLSSNHNDVIKV